MANKSERFELRINEDQLCRVDEWASEQSDRPTRAEAIRRLVDSGLSAASSRSVHFSDGEKMLLLMMGDLFKSLKIKNPDCDPDLLAQTIYGGHYWAPKWEMQGVFHDHVDDPRDVSHVVDVLDMWSFIEEAFEGLSPDQKSVITEEVGSRASNVKFHGFDGNNESSQMSIARFLVGKMGRFSRFEGRDLNSHCPTYERYLRMLDAFNPMRRGLSGRALSTEQIVILLNA